MFINRLRIFGSPKAKKILYDARAHFELILKKDIKSPGSGVNIIENIEIAARTAGILGADDGVMKDFFVYIYRVSRVFAKCVARETGKIFIDKTIDKTLEELALEKDEKKKDGKNGRPINGNCGKRLDRGQKANTNDEKVKADDGGR